MVHSPEGMFQLEEERKSLWYHTRVLLHKLQWKTCAKCFLIHHDRQVAGHSRRGLGETESQGRLGIEATHWDHFRSRASWNKE